MCFAHRVECEVVQAKLCIRCELRPLLKMLRPENEYVFSFMTKKHLNETSTVQAFNFASRGYFKSFFGYDREKDGQWKWLAGNVASGSAAGATTSLLLYHLDYARTRLATDAIESRGTKRQYRGLLDVYKKTLATDGMSGLYRGFSVSIMGITLYRGLYFGIYDSMKPLVLVGPLEVLTVS